MRRLRIHLSGLLAAFIAISIPPVLHAQARDAYLIRDVPDSAVVSALQFRSLGPAVMSGRISDIAVPEPGSAGERYARTYYVAAAGGGVWKTTNAGVTWSPIFDDQRVSSIGDVAVAPTNPDIVWVGTGESNNLRSSSWGDGIYRSDDAGRTWTHRGLRQSQHIARIVVHPTNPDIVFVAAMGPLWGSGGERGFYRTTDGGRTWRNTLQRGPFTGVTDIVLDPRDPNVIYTATYQRERKPWSFVAGGPESGVWKSTDGGETWTQLTNGLPTGNIGRIGIDVARSQPNTLYATVHADDGGVFRSDDAGASWTRVSDLQSIPWFFGQIRVDPQNPERVYHLGVSLSVSDDGGRTYRAIARNTHADHHAMWIDPADPAHLIIGNDGGLFTSHDAGESWDFASNLPVSTFYHVSVDLRDPYWVYGGLQDNGTWGAPSRTFSSQGASNYDWLRVGGGDGFHSASDPTDPTIVYLESQNGALSRFNTVTHESKGIRPPVEDGDPPHRYNWSAPLLISPHDNRTLYFGAQYLFRSRDRGDSWEKVSGDLTRNLDRDTLPIMGMNGPGGLGRHDGTAEYGNLSTIDESPLRAGVLITGTDDGVVQVTTDGGSNWHRVERFPGVPALTYVSRVIASAHDANTFYATFDGHRDNDFAPYVMKSTDAGRTWTSIAGNLPEGSVYIIREHTRTPNLLFVGAEYGVFTTVDGGRSWSRLDNGIAPAPVHDLVIHPRENDLVVGTHGRGMFVLDDITPLEILASRSRLEGAVVAAPRPATVRSTRRSVTLFGDRNYNAENPATGASISYAVAPGTTGSGTLRIVDGQGRTVRELPASLTPGLHRVRWDLRWTSAAAAAGGSDSTSNRGPQGPAGLLAEPGRYTVRLASGTRVLSEAPLEVRADPEVTLSQAELSELYAARARAYELQLAIQTLIGSLESQKRQLQQSVDSVAAQPLIAAVDSVLDGLRPPPRRQQQGGAPQVFVSSGAATAAPPQPLLNRVNTVAGAIGSSHFMPTPAHLRTLDEAATELAAATRAAEEVTRRIAAPR